MILPGLVSIAFYRRRPSFVQVLLGLVFTIVLSGLLGYWQDYGTSRVGENTTVAIAGGVVVYFVVYALLLYWYFPRHEVPRKPTTATPTDPRA